MRWNGFIVGMLALATVAGNVRADEPPVTIYFHVRPPYAAHGAPAGVKGLLVTPVIQALNEAGLSAQWSGESRA